MTCMSRYTCTPVKKLFFISFSDFFILFLRTSCLLTWYRTRLTMFIFKFCFFICSFNPLAEGVLSFLFYLPQLWLLPFPVHGCLSSIVASHWCVHTHWLHLCCRSFYLFTTLFLSSHLFPYATIDENHNTQNYGYTDQRQYSSHQINDCPLLWLHI